MIDDANKEAFRRYIGSLKIGKATKGTYRSWVNRLDRRLADNLADVPAFTEREVWRLAEAMGWKNKGDISSARVMLRHFGRYRDNAAILAAQAEQEPPKDDRDGRRKVLQSIAVRRGQRDFREALFKKFGGRCVVTLTDDQDTLEAAHIKPYSQNGTSVLGNGLLLRADIHVLFDLHLMSINPDSLSVHCHSSLQSSATYGVFHGRKSLLAEQKIPDVDPNALREHFEETAA